MTSIKITEALSPELVLIFNALIKNLQQRFDMAPTVLENWLNQPKFIAWIQKRYRQMEIKMLGDLNSQPEIVELLEIYQSKQPLDVLIRNLGWEKEECGHLYHKYDNGYHHYCNLTRFEHLSRENSVIVKQQLDHTFLRKTYQQMIDEKLFEYKFQAYQRFMNQVLRVLLNHFNQRLQQDYRIYRFTYQADIIRPILNWLKKHPEAFRAKTGLSESKEHPQIYLDIYVPHLAESDTTKDLETQTDLRDPTKLELPDLNIQAIAVM